MNWRRLLFRFRDRARRDAELAQDIESYLDAETEANIARGVNPAAARERARKKFGNITLVREEVYRMNGTGLLETLRQDGFYGFRQLRRNAGFTAVAGITLALGIGAATAIFSVVNGVLLRPLPYPDPGRLAWVTEQFALAFSPGAVLGPDFVAWRRENQVFQQIEGFLSSQGPAISLSGLGEPVAVRMTSVTTGLFPMLGLHPLAGRTLTAEDGRIGHENVLLLSERLWEAHFGASRAVLGRTVRLNDAAFTVIGVMPGNVEYPQADVWTPLVLDSSLFLPRSRPMALVSVIGRLQKDITVSKAQSNLALITHGIDKEYPPQFVRSRDRNVEVVPLHAQLVRNARPLLLILLGSVSFVFLIACANVANLSFSRAAGRVREFAVRRALGAGRQRLIQQLLTETLLLAIIGSGFGVVCGVWSVGLLKRLIPPSLPGAIELDLRILAFAIGITVLATLLSGLTPALVASRTEVSEALKASSARAGTGRATHRLRDGLVVCEIALSLILLTGAGLLARSFLHLTSVHLGFNPNRVLMAQVSRPMTRGLQTPSPAPFFNEVLRKIRALPGVRDAGAISRAPLSTCAGFSAPIRPRGAPTDLQSVCQSSVTPEYFRTMEVPLLKGRFFADRDSSDGLPVVLMNESLAREVFGNAEAIGQQVGVYGLSGLSWRTVVGVVADTKNSTLEQQPWPEIFVPYSQALLPLSATFVLRTESDPAAVAGLVRKAVEAVDPNQSVSSVQTLNEAMESSTASQGFRMLLLGLFAMIALTLAAIGVFGVMAYTVSQRTHEMGVRVALGARPTAILGLAVGHGMRVTAIGLGVGLIGAVSLTRFLSAFLYEVKATDVPTFLAALLLLTGTALFACYIPARRAARVDPLVALRNE